MSVVSSIYKCFQIIERDLHYNGLYGMKNYIVLGVTKIHRIVPHVVYFLLKMPHGIHIEQTRDIDFHLWLQLQEQYPNLLPNWYTIRVKIVINITKLRLPARL